MIKMITVRIITNNRDENSMHISDYNSYKIIMITIKRILDDGTLER